MYIASIPLPLCVNSYCVHVVCESFGVGNESKLRELCMGSLLMFYLPIIFYKFIPVTYG